MNNTEEFYQKKEGYGNNGMYRVYAYVEGTDELRMIATYTADDQVIEAKVFRNGHLYSRSIINPDSEQGMILHKTMYSENGRVKAYVEFTDSKVYTTNYDEDGNVESVVVRDKVTD